MSYQPSLIVRKVAEAPPLDVGPGHPAWARATVATVDSFHHLSTAHRPRTEARLLHDRHNLYLQFDVSDRYVRSLETDYQGNVCHDSCVEFFVEPVPGKGYFNFELNCGGAMMLMYIEDPTWIAGKPKRFCSVWPEHARHVRIHTSMPKVTDPEIQEPVKWRLSASIPLHVFEPYVGRVAPLNGQPWRGNFYKCGDKTSHPHWASWAPINGYLNFHQPQYFGALHFEH
jgi:hypothetical protein